MHFTGGMWRFSDGTVIGAFQHHLTGARFDSDSPENVSKNEAGPFGIADGAKLPLDSLYFGRKKDPAISRAFNRRDQIPFLELLQLVEGEFHRTFDRAFDS